MNGASRPSVLHLIDTTGPGGAETIFLQVARGLADRGWGARSVVVGPGWVLDQLRALDLPVDVVPTRGRLDWRYLRGIRGVMRRHGCRLIHAHLFSPTVYASLVGAWIGAPVVATFHGASDTEAGGRSRRLRYRLIDHQAEVVCVSEALRDDLRRSPVREDRVRVIHNGVDAQALTAASGAAVRKEYGVPDDAFLVGALGNLRPAKDFPNLLRAAALLASDRRLAFAVVGQRTQPLYGHLLELRDSLGLANRLSFWGFRSDVPEVISAFDALVISSRSEGFSLAAIQAMAAGTPVVATRSGGPDEIITDGANGLLVPPASPESLAAGVRRLLAEPGLRNRLAAAARERVRERFSLSAMLDRYESLYEKLLRPDGGEGSYTRAKTVL